MTTYSISRAITWGLSSPLPSRPILGGDPYAGIDYLAVIAWHQSNMVGGHRDSNGATTSSPADDGVSNLWQWSPTGGAAGQEAFANTLIAASVPLRFPLYGAADYANLVSPMFGYGKLLAAAYPTKQIVLIPGGRGGTNMSEWYPGQSYYETVEASWDAFRAAYPNSILHSMLSSPLENEMVSVAAPSSVRTGLTTVINGWRALEGASSETKVVLGAAVPAYVSSDNSRAILLEGAKAAVRLPNVGVIGGLTGGSVGGDTVHYTNTANRTRDDWMYEQVDSLIDQFQSSVPQVTDLEIDSETLTFTSVGAPYYLFQHRVYPGGGAWTNVEWVPNQDNRAGQAITLTMPGSGDRECRVIAMGYGGATTWYTESTFDYRGGEASAAVVYEVPDVIVPTPYVHLDMPNAVLSGSNYTSIPSNGTNTGSWTAGVTTIPVFDLDAGAGVYNIPAMAANRRFDQAGFTFPSGNLSILIPLYLSSLGNGVLVSWKQASASGDIYFQHTPGGNMKLAFTNANPATSLVTTNTPLAGQTSKYHCLGCTYDRTINEGKLYLNGSVILTTTGLMTQRSASPSNSGGTSIGGYNADTPTSNGFNGRLVDFYYWNSVLTQEQMQKQQADVAAARGITFG